MNVPNDLRYSREHEWIRLEGEIAYVGITDFAQSELGDIVYVEVNTVGETLEAGAVFGTVDAVKTTSDLFLPVSGEILEVNPALVDTPELVNQAPYSEGWIVKIKPTNLTELDELLDAEAYRELIGA